MIKVYPSILPGEPIETHDAHGMTVGAWLSDNVKGFDIEREYHPISVTVDGNPIPASHWPLVYISVTSVVEIRVLPQSSAFKSIGSALSSLASAVGSIVNAAVSLVRSIFGFILPNSPGQNVSAGRQGSSIYDPNVQANRPRIGGVIPEIAGQHKTFPDYLNQPRRYFVDERTLSVDMMLCVGIGEYLVPTAQVRIGSTPINALSQQVNLAIFAPGEDVTGHPGHVCWYNAPEVGATVGSGAGLRLKNPQDVTLVWAVDSVDVSGNAVDRVSGEFVPPDWTVGTALEIQIPRPITASPPVDPMVDPRVVFGGSFADLGLSVNDEVTIVSDDIGGDFVVASVSASELTLSYPDLTPVTEPTSGTYIATIDRTGAKYRVDSVSVIGGNRTGIVVTKLLNGGVEDTGWLGFPAQRSSNPLIRISGDAANGEWAGPFLGCPAGETVSGVEWDVFAPQGLGRVRGNGSINERTREIELQWRPVRGTTWTSDIRQVTGRTRDQLGWTFQTDFGANITPEIRVRRTTVEATGVQDLDRLEWFGLKSRVTTPSSYPGITTMALTIQGSDTIAGQSENRVSCVVTRLLNGSPTRSIGDWVRYVLADSEWPEEGVDEDTMSALEALWSSRGETFDFVHDDESTVKEVLIRTLRAGMSELTVDSGVVSPVRDGVRGQIEQMYTPQNMLPPGLERQVSMIRHDDVDGIDVEYFDGTTWTNETVECRLPGDQGIRAEKIRVEGVTSRTRAWRIGMRERRKLRYRRWLYQFSTELDALTSRYLSYVALADDVPGYGQSSLVKEVSIDGAAVTLLLSELVPDNAELLAWRRPDGTLSGPWPIESKDGFIVTVTATEAPQVLWTQELPHALLGEADRWHFPSLITRIRPQGQSRVQVQAVNYDERVYSDDDSVPPQ